GRVHRAVDEQPRRWSQDVRENRAGLQLDNVTATPPARRKLELRIVQLLADSLAGDDGERHIRPLPLRELLDEDVDLAAAGQADSESHLVGDPVREQPRGTTRDDLL